ncbi:MAG: prolyl oligopeptidase family serine peptidase [Burkholderiaceae bacterium]|nr:prolyl oligopeptidase family serine peptidase [Burkholderiaceae bacterium]
MRGGAELGEDWYEDGKLAHKQNTFNDFVDVTDFLVREKYAGKVFASGGSAGGLLMGAIANQAGMKYAGISLWVPFVDVITTMLDETIPLTANEWTQWGDPRVKADHDRMLAYSPYDNLARKDYPPMIVHAGLWDSQVQYFEPAKYVARLRARKTDSNPLLLHMDLEARMAEERAAFHACATRRGSSCSFSIWRGSRRSAPHRATGAPAVSGLLSMLSRTTQHIEQTADALPTTARTQVADPCAAPEPGSRIGPLGLTND